MGQRLLSENIHCTMYIIQCTMYNVQYICTLYNVHHILYRVHCTVYCTVYIVQYTANNIQCTLYTVICIVAMHPTLILSDGSGIYICRVYIQYTLYNIRYICM